MPGAVDPAAGQPADGPQAEAGHNPTPHQRRRTSVTHRRPSGDKPSPQRPRLEEWRRHRSGPGKVARSLQSRTREPTTGKGVRHGALRNAAATDPSPRLAASPLDRHKPGCTGTHSVTRSTSTRRHNIAGHNSDRRKHGELCKLSVCAPTTHRMHAALERPPRRHRPARLHGSFQQAPGGIGDGFRRPAAVREAVSVTGRGCNHSRGVQAPFGEQPRLRPGPRLQHSS
mmetsp:Transcript_2276/g.8839  ORF Transcript_2276/g.8839 Transcript_2276/m.8839 type:complete len:228 (-) Transcript_2276:413-1096(-)